MCVSNGHIAYWDRWIASPNGCLTAKWNQWNYETKVKVIRRLISSKQPNQWLPSQPITTNWMKKIVHQKLTDVWVTIYVYFCSQWVGRRNSYQGPSNPQLHSYLYLMRIQIYWLFHPKRTCVHLSVHWATWTRLPFIRHITKKNRMNIINSK